MSTVSSLQSPIDLRRSAVSKGFSSLSAVLHSHSEAQLQKSGPWFSTSDAITTSISPSGWIATASAKQVCLYDVQNGVYDTRIKQTIAVEMKFENERIRAVALSNDLLAVVTHDRLLMYEDYKAASNGQERPSGRTGINQHKPFDTRHLNQGDAWVPRTVSIIQTDSGLFESGSTAFVAAGGEGENGISLFSYSFGIVNCWNTQPGRIILKCPGNLGMLKSVSFSPAHRHATYGPMIVALTTRNQLYCWSWCRTFHSSVQSMQPVWRVDCNPTNNQQSYSDEISSATLLVSYTGRPYVFCTVDHKRGSHLRPSFLVPIDVHEKSYGTIQNSMRSIPATILGASVIAGIPSSNGHFLVVVEKEKKATKLKVLTLHSARDGGLICTPYTLSWQIKLEHGRQSTLSISICVKEQKETLRIVAVDGAGRFTYAVIGVPNMLEPETPPLQRRPTFEMPADVQIPELAYDESGNRESLGIFELPADRYEIVPG